MNTFGRRLRIHIFGESHGHGIGVLLDGIPPGLPVDQEAIQAALDRRRPGTGPLVSARNEPDTAVIQSGVHEDLSTGAPLLVWIGNQDVRSRDYSEVLRKPRPGHADWVNRAWSHGHADLRGGGHSSGRLTAGLVAAAAIVAPLLDQHNIRVGAHLHQVGSLAGTANSGALSVADLHKARSSPIHTAHADEESTMVDLIQAARESKDSVGGIVSWRAEGIPVALGDPFFDSVESLLAHMLFSVPAVKGVDFGQGFASASMKGSEHNDPLAPGKDGTIQPTSNHAGGILGGRTTGAPLWGSVAIKPTSSIFQPQNTVDIETGESAVLELKGRHDPCIAIRAVPVVEAAIMLVLADLVLQAKQEGHL